TEGKLWDVASGNLVRSLSVGNVGGMRAAFSPDGKQIAIGNRNHTTHIYEVKTGKLLHELPRKMTHELKYSPDGKLLAVTYVNGEIALWDPASGNLVRAWASGADEVYTVDWNRKGDVLVCAG